MATVQAPPNFDAENAGNFEDVRRRVEMCHGTNAA